MTDGPNEVGGPFGRASRPILTYLIQGRRAAEIAADYPIHLPGPLADGILILDVEGHTAWSPGVPCV